MKIFVTAKPNAKENSVVRLDETHYKVSVKAPPDDGRANQAVLEVLSDFFRVPKTRVVILSGHRSKTKIIGIR